MDFSALGSTCVVGLQWGDEGKGKIVDLLTPHYRAVVRYAGGANAGHTVWVGGEKFALHLLPSGILTPGVTSIIGPGVVLDCELVIKEIDGLRARGIKIGENLKLSSRAHLVMPYHKKQDRLAEASLDPDRKIGTTAKGIGPCYADKMLRSGAFRVADLYEPDAFRERLASVVDQKNKLFAALYGDCEPLNANEIADACLAAAETLRPFVADTTALLHRLIADNERILFEGAQGSLLDINHGTFPYVTSSTSTAAGAAATAGVPPRSIQDYLGVVKAYSTRVGSGPFPTELDNEIGNRIRERGHEYGTTTGRPRRCGWFDAVAVRYAIALGGITELIVMHLDTLSTFEELRVCTGYRLRGERVESFPASASDLAAVEPVYETLPGWADEIVGVDSCEQLPAAARRYLERLESLLGVPITLVSVGAERTATLHREAGIASVTG